MILLVDSNFLCYRAFFTTGNMYHRDIPTGVIFGFLNQLFRVVQDLRPDEIIFVWDSARSLRKERFPFYKSKKRHEIDPVTLWEMYEQFDRLKNEILPGIGFFNNCFQEGYEADDIIAAGVHRFGGAGRPNSISVGDSGAVVILSSDEDLYQLLSKNVGMYKSSNKKVYTGFDFSNEWGIKPRDWVKVKMIAGCNSDNVPGVPGVGDKTAVKFLRGELKSGSQKHKAIIKFLEHPELWERNQWLVRLPLEGAAVPNISSPSQFSPGRFRKVCRQYGLRRLAKNGIDEYLEVLFDGKKTD